MDVKYRIICAYFIDLIIKNIDFVNVDIVNKSN